MPTNKKVLIIEDEPAILYALKKNLAEAGYNVLAAEDGEKGLNLMKTEKPDVILLDIILPKINGFDILEIAKRHEETKNIPIVVLTNLNDNDSIAKSAALGAAGHLIKIENQPKDVLEKITMILEKNKALNKNSFSV